MHFLFLQRLAVHPDLHFSLHDALPILQASPLAIGGSAPVILDLDLIWPGHVVCSPPAGTEHTTILSSGQESPLNTPDRKSTRLNSSHSSISYAVFCLTKKKKKQKG